MARLSEYECKVIVEICHRLDPASTVYLYGSRIDSLLKGGDIDLLVVSDVLTFTEKLDILSMLKERLGDQKIDVTIITGEALKTDPFFSAVAKEKL